MKQKESIKISIVEDSKPYLNLLSMFIKQISNEEKIDVEVALFDNPVDYKVNRDYYDIVILDYVFRQYTYGANGFYLAKFTKERLPNSYIVINSSYGRPEIGDMLHDFDKFVNSYSHKETDMYEENIGLLSILRKVMKDIWDNRD